MTENDIQDVGEALKDLGDALRRAKAENRRNDHYFWKAYPFIENDPNLWRATIEREREHR